jgi:O-antigen biosynthesis protein
MMLSVITPLHRPGNRFIEAAYASLTLQSPSVEWEWIVLENHGGKVPDGVRSDRRTRVHQSDAASIGALKAQAIAHAKGDLFVELDADDLLHPDCLARLAAAPGDVLFSDFAEFVWPSWAARTDAYPYNPAMGWSHYEVECPAVLGEGQARSLLAMRAPEATAHNLRFVDWAPNHVRAFRRDAYERAGGHDRTMAVGDDHDLLVRLFLAGARFTHVCDCLYFYRVHGHNTVAAKNAAIRAATERVYERSIFALGEKFADDRGLLKVDLCGGVDPYKPGEYRVLDQEVESLALGLAWTQCDLEQRWPLQDSSVGVLRASDAIEHLSSPIHTMNEAYRVLAPGGFFMIRVPSTNGVGAFCDPTHKSYWNLRSFRYYTEASMARYVRAFRGRFQVSRAIEYFQTKAHEAENLPYVDAQLFCAKDGFRAMGPYHWPEPG